MKLICGVLRQNKHNLLFISSSRTSIKTFINKIDGREDSLYVFFFIINQNNFAVPKFHIFIIKIYIYEYNVGRLNSGLGNRQLFCFFKV
jgi:hypothetical protein